MSQTELEHSARRAEVRRYVGVDEAAKFLGVSRSWMYRESKRHGVPRYHFGGKLRFQVTELAKWAQQQRVS
ncbi:helix-turn-helix domain-containing protein [Streptomyces sp. DT190]|uniref:helix-turn-helix domain-containing protein n=1 Tax=unclassified Streptomyces TaxID=2593676 RepID=UPI003CEDDA24